MLISLYRPLVYNPLPSSRPSTTTECLHSDPWSTAHPYLSPTSPPPSQASSPSREYNFLNRPPGPATRSLFYSPRHSSTTIIHITPRSSLITRSTRPFPPRPLTSTSLTRLRCTAQALRRTSPARSPCQARPRPCRRLCPPGQTSHSPFATLVL